MWKADGEKKRYITFSEKTDNKHRKLHVRKSKEEYRGEISLKNWKKKKTVNLENPWKQLLKVKTKSRFSSDKSWNNLPPAD